MRANNSWTQLPTMPHAAVASDHSSVPMAISDMRCPRSA
jgi:hypothetical protein